MEYISKIEQKVEKISDIQRSHIYELVRKVSKETIDEVCPALLRTILNTEKGPLKTQLGNVIFHLQKNDRLNTVIGLQKLLDASLLVAPEEMFKILESSDEDAKELAQKIKALL
ncbi:hypothetical protein LCGC14_0266750 [marine sediment metagenome]|uniref:Uncharacterized protein n=1 Tax=marine sediment metagenome TaxID=412755 RepID=A0A0F9UH77_9ZZZZ